MGVISQNLYLLGAALVLNACISIGQKADGDNIQKTHIGLILVEHRSGNSGLSYTDITTGGVWLENDGAGIGIKNQMLITADPKCQVIFITRTQEQLDHAYTLLKASLDNNQGEICLEKF